jgi:hypothetical protein
MTEDRLKLEVDILKQLYPYYIIKNPGAKDIYFVFKYKAFQYIIYDFHEYPFKIPRIKSTDELLIKLLKEFKSSLSHYEITLNETEAKLDIIPHHEFSPNWSILKIVRITNEYIENMQSIKVHI